MSAIWTDTLAALDRRLGPGRRAHLVRRTEISERGELWITLEEDGRPRWLAARAGELVEIRPEEDAALPAAAPLAALERAGRARILSWRPGRRIVARVEDGSRSRIVKGYRPTRLAPALLSHWRAEQRFGAESFLLPRLVGEEPGLCALAFSELDAMPLDAARAAPATWREIGRRLDRFQRAEPRGLPLHTREHELSILDRHAVRFALVAGEPPPAWTELRSRLAPLSGRATDAAFVDGSCVPVHRDLHDGQILLAGTSFALLDFDLLCRGERALDPANLAVHAHVRALEHGRPDPAPALVEGLDRASDPGFAEAFEFYSASTALRLVLLAALRPAWMPFQDDLLATASVRVAECERA